MATIGASLFLAANPMSFFSSLLIMTGASLVDSYIISALTPASQVSQGKVNDLSVQTASVGTAIIKGYGKARITGNIVWGTKFVEHVSKTTTSSGGKGGGGSKTETTTYTYSSSFAIMLCEGPIVGVSNVWADGNDFALKNVDYRLYTGTEYQEPDDFMESVEGVGFVPAYKGMAYIVFRNMLLTDYGNRIPTFSFVVEFPKNNLKDIVEEISEEAGLVLQQDVDAASLSNLTVQGFTRNGSKTFKEQMNELRVVHIFEGTERFGKLVFAPRDFTKVIAISSGEIGAYETNKAEEPFQVTTKYDLELPKRLNLTYYSSDNKYQTGSQGAYRQLAGGVSEESLSTSVVLSDAVAKAVAEMRLYEMWMARTGYEFKLPMKYGYLLPGDILELNLPDDIGKELVVITKANFGKPGLNVISASKVDSANYKLVTRSVDETPEEIVNTPSEVFAYMMDIPKLPVDSNSSDDYVYMAIGAKAFYGANVYRSYDSGVSYDHLATYSNPGIFGEAVTVLGNANPCFWDNGHSVTVKLIAGTLESRSKEDILNYYNAAVLGDEIIQFTSAELVTEDTYKLSGLLRGRNGTEHYVSEHKAGERFVLLGKNNISAVPVTSEYWYTELAFRIGPRGDSVINETYKDVSFTAQGISQRPWSVCHVKGTRDSDGNLTVFWIRRTRKNGSWKDFSDVPLSENSEVYEVEVMKNGAVVRTIGMTAPSYVYSADLQVEDFGKVQESVAFRIYQISEIRGRGIVKEVAV
jgi:hypothetical protein